MAYCGGEEAIFKQSQKALEKIPGIGSKLAKKLSSQSVLSRAEDELKFAQQNAIGLHFYLDENYPNRLKHCEDGPVVLFSKGKCLLQSRKMHFIGRHKKCNAIWKRLYPHANRKIESP